jgi:hypothetical protein
MAHQTTLSMPDRVDRSDRYEWARFRKEPALLERAKFLGEGDQKLIELSLRYNLTRRQMGTALGLTAGTITRKLRQLIARLRDPLIVAITHPDCTLPPLHRQIGIEYFLHRSPIPRLALKHEMTRTEIREMLEFIRGWHRGAAPTNGQRDRQSGAEDHEDEFAEE